MLSETSLDKEAPAARNYLDPVIQGTFQLKKYIMFVDNYTLWW